MLFRWESEVLSLLRLRLLPLLRSARLSPRSVINVMRVLSLLSGWLYKAALCSDLMFESGGQHLSNISAKSAYHHTIKKTMPVNILYHVSLSKAALINWGQVLVLILFYVIGQYGTGGNYSGKSDCLVLPENFMFYDKPMKVWGIWPKHTGAIVWGRWVKAFPHFSSIL